MIHDLKTEQPYFDLIVSGKKTFEVRRNDRDFKLYDILNLQEYIPFKFINPLGYTGREIKVIVTYILKGNQFGISPDYVVMGIKEIPK